MIFCYSETKINSWKNLIFVKLDDSSAIEYWFDFGNLGKEETLLKSMK